MARRLVEAGVRFVQVFPPLKPSFQPWDSHKNLKAELESICGQTDKPAAALVTDLKSRGLLDETIVIWTGEFGRLPVTQNANGRDHNRNGFGLFLAGGGFKNGHIHGASDEFGYRAVDRPGERSRPARDGAPPAWDRPQPPGFHRTRHRRDADGCEGLRGESCEGDS